MRARGYARRLESGLTARGLALTAGGAWAAACALLAVRFWRLQDDAAAGAARACGVLAGLHAAAVLLCANAPLVALLRETGLARVLDMDALMPGLHGVLGLGVVAFGGVHGGVQVGRRVFGAAWEGAGVRGDVGVFVTGVLCFVLLAVVRAGAWLGVRRSWYEAFVGAHVYGGAAFYVLLGLHGVRNGAFQTWKWIAGPGALAAVVWAAGVVRERRGYLLVSKHCGLFCGDGVLRLRFPRVFGFQPGQYAEIKVPEVSGWQWHPFTIASAPHDGDMVFYVKVAGDWTTEVFQLFASRMADHQEVDIEVHVRGPYGAPAQQVALYDHIVLIGGGVGATPFCSVVKSLDHWMAHWANNAADAAKRPARRDRRRPLAPSSLSFSAAAVIAAVNTDEEAGLESVSDGDGDEPPSSPASVPRGSSRRSVEHSLDTYYTANSHMTGFRSRELPAPTAVEREERRRSIRLATSIQSDASVLGTSRVHWRRRLESDDESPTHWDKMTNYTSLSSVTHWQGLNSIDTATHSRTYTDGLDMLITMSFGVPDLMATLQARTRTRESLGLKPLEQARSADPRAIDLSILHDRGFQALMACKSATVAVFLLWIVVARLFFGVAAAEAGLASFRIERLSVHSPATLVAIDTGLCAVLVFGTCVPVILEIHTLGFVSLTSNWADLLLTAPPAVTSLLLSVLALFNLGESDSLSARSGLSLVAPCVLLVLGFISRLTRLARTRAGAPAHVHAAPQHVRRDGSLARSVEFIWTTPTRGHDAWLVSEMKNLESSRIRLRRYVTRESNADDGSSNDSEEGASPLGGSGTVMHMETNFGRPDWNEVVNGIAERAQNGAVVGVFVCAPGSMSSAVHAAASEATRNSVVRGLQGGRTMRALEQAFGDAIGANEHTGDDGNADDTRGCNVRMSFHRERFS